MYCQKCGAPNDDQAAFCERCGTALQGQSPEIGPTAPALPAPVQYAGFWRRLAAALIDGVLLSVAWFATGVAIVSAYSAISGLDADEVSDSTAVGLVYLSWGLAFILGWLYYAAMESSATRATLGKMALSIAVTNMNGQRVSFGRATGRYFGRVVSGLILCIGYIIIAFTQKKQGLHDIMADCLVVVKSRSHPPL